MHLYSTWLHHGLRCPQGELFLPLPRSGDAPLQVNFTNESSGIVTSWLWNFGDGTTSTDVNPAHTYNSPGTYKAKLTVYGPGGSGSKTMSITVKK